MNLNMITQGALNEIKTCLLDILKGMGDLPENRKMLRDAFVERLDEFVAWCDLNDLKIKEKQEAADRIKDGASIAYLEHAATLAIRGGDWKAYGEFKEEIGRRWALAELKKTGLKEIRQEINHS